MNIEVSQMTHIPVTQISLDVWETTCPHNCHRFLTFDIKMRTVCEKLRNTSEQVFCSKPLWKGHVHEWMKKNYRCYEKPWTFILFEFADKISLEYVEEKIHLNFRGRNNFCIVFVIIPLNFYGASITWNYATNSNYPKHIPTIHKWKKFKYRIILTHTNFSYHLYKMDSNFSFMLKCMHCMIDWNNKEKST